MESGRGPSVATQHTGTSTLRIRPAKIYVGHLWCDPKKAMDSKLDPACRHPSVCCRSQDQDLKFTTKWNQKNARLIQEHRWDLFTRRSPDGQPLLLKGFANWKLCRSSPTSTSHSYLIVYVSIDQTEAKFRNPMLNWETHSRKTPHVAHHFHCSQARNQPLDKRPLDEWGEYTHRSGATRKPGVDFVWFCGWAQGGGRNNKERITHQPQGWG